MFLARAVHMELFLHGKVRRCNHIKKSSVFKVEQEKEISKAIGSSMRRTEVHEHRAVHEDKWFVSLTLNFFFVSIMLQRSIFGQGMPRTRRRVRNF